MKDLNKELAKIDPIDLPEVPVVRNTPEGWPCYCTEDGETWYEKAMSYQTRTGNRPVPLKYYYDENNQLQLAPETYYEENWEEPEIPEDIKQNGGFYVWPAKEDK